MQQAELRRPVRARRTGSAICSSLPGSGESPVAVSASIAGLVANTTYHFRISATNAGGTSKGADESFKTAPSCTAEGFYAAISGGFQEPNAVAVDVSSAERFLVADTGNSRVEEWLKSPQGAGDSLCPISKGATE